MISPKRIIFYLFQYQKMWHVNINIMIVLIYGIYCCRYDDNKNCIRCFRLLRRSRNVIEVFSEALNRCYIYESAALASCDTLNSTSILYRK